MPHHETALDWFQRSRRRRHHEQQQQLHQQNLQHDPASFSQVLHDLLFLKSHQPIMDQTYEYDSHHGTITTTATTTGSSSHHAPQHFSSSSTSSSSLPMIVLEGCSMAKSWIMIHMIHEWVTTTPYSVLVMNGETNIQLGLLPLLLRNTGNTHHNHNDTTQESMTTTTTRRIVAAQDYMQRIHFGMGSVALLELVRYSCAASAAVNEKNNNKNTNTSTSTSTGTEPLSSSSSPSSSLLLLWDDYPDDPDITRQLGRMIQSFPQQLSVVVAGKWSGGLAQRIHVERVKKNETWMATVAGKRYEFRITMEGILG